MSDKIPNLAEWEDKAVQRIYEILSDQLESKPEDEHWEGYCARWIVGEIIAPLRDRIARLEAENVRLSAPVSDSRPRKLIISHAQGDSDVVAIYGGLPTTFLKSFDDDETAQKYIDNGAASKDLKAKDAARKEGSRP